jgi:hypothetical protein
MSFWNQVAGNANAITPSDTVNLTGGPVVLYIGVTGNISVLTAGGDTATFVDVQAGSVLPVRVKRVNSTGTTASSMLALS